MPLRALDRALILHPGVISEFVPERGHVNQLAFKPGKPPSGTVPVTAQP
jgi:hypothetical protein